MPDQIVITTKVNRLILTFHLPLYFFFLIWQITPCKLNTKIWHLNKMVEEDDCLVVYLNKQELLKTIWDICVKLKPGNKIQKKPLLYNAVHFDLLVTS